MRPTASEVMDTIVWTFDHHVAPNMGGELPTSLAKTVSNMLRHVQLRLQHEAGALWDDNDELRGLLGQVEAFARRHQALAAFADEFQTQLPPRAGSAGYPDLAAVSSEATQLRWTLQRAIETLQRVRDDFRSVPDYGEVRQAIRAYLEHQLAREAGWIDAAFTGPRR